MKPESILQNKRILIIDEEAELFDFIREKINTASPTCNLDWAASYNKAVDLMVFWTYDLVLLDFQIGRALDLLYFTRIRQFLTALLIEPTISVELLNKSLELKAEAYLPKSSLSDIILFLQYALSRATLRPGLGIVDKLRHLFYRYSFRYSLKYERLGWGSWGRLEQVTKKPALWRLKKSAE